MIADAILLIYDMYRENLLFIHLEFSIGKFVFDISILCYKGLHSKLQVTYFKKDMSLRIKQQLDNFLQRLKRLLLPCQPICPFIY